MISARLTRISFAALFAVLLVAGTFSTVPLAHAAQLCPSGSNSQCTDVNGVSFECDTSQTPYTCVADDTGSGSGSVAAGGACTSDGQCQDELACLPEGGPNSHCGTDSSLDDSSAASAAQSTPTAKLSGNAIPSSSVFDTVMSWLMTVFAWLLGIAAITLDNAMYYTVVHMGSYVNGLSAIGVAWRILRDIGNIVLIFGFVALGITVILDVNWYGGGTKMLPTLLIAAIFLNFSLFAAEAVIDVGNLFATEFYTQINNGSAAAGTFDYSPSAIANNGISLAVMNQLGLQTIYGAALSNNNSANNNLGGIFNSGLGNISATPAPSAPNAGGVLTAGNPFIVGFMAILLFIIAAFVFFSLAFILIARFIFLIFLIILAPIGIAGLAVPKLDGYARQWWGSLFEQTITAPVMLLMLYVALAVITDSNFLVGFGVGTSGGSIASNTAQTDWVNWLAGGQGVTGLASIMLSFFVAMGLLLAVTMLAKRMGAVGATWATSTVQRAGTMALGVATYVPRMGARKATYHAGTGLEKFRNTSAGRVAAKVIQIGTAGIVSDIDLKRGTAAMQNVKYGTRYSEKELVDFEKKDKPERDSAMRKSQAAADIAAAIKVADPADEASRTVMDDKIAAALKTLNDKEIAELKGVKDGVEELVRNLSPQTFKNIMENKEISEEQKNKVRDARFQKINADLKPHLDVLSDAASTDDEKQDARRSIQGIVRPIPNSDLENAPQALLDNDSVLDAMAETTRTDLIKGGKVAPSVIRRLKERDPSEKVKKAFADAGGVAAASSGAGAAAARAIVDAKLKPAKVAELPPEILKTEEVMDGFTPAVMAELAKQLTSKDREEIADYFQHSLPSGTGRNVETMKRFFKGPAGDVWGVTIP